MKKISGIYGISCKIDGKIYIGQSNNIKKRWSDHQSKLRHNKHGNKNLQEAFNTYGEYNIDNEENFKYIIIEECKQSDLNVLESKWKTYYEGNLYNKNNIINLKKKIRRGRESVKVYERYSKQNQGENNPNCTKFNDEKIIDIKTMIRDGIDLKVIADKYNTTYEYIKLIKGNYKWKHIVI
jgi:group I intron endonuclease